MRRIIVTGGAGFIGSALVARLLQDDRVAVLTVDKLTYAGNRKSLTEALASPRHQFLHADICNAAAMDAALARFRPDTVFNLAAETHVDRSIASADAFVATNVAGVATLLRATQTYFDRLSAEERGAFRFVHVSTDEVFGALGPEGVFTEQSPYAPNSPYAASKAGGDHLVRAWINTHGLPALITHCCNNYGPRQHPEKLIPRTIVHALMGKPLPVYGEGAQIRDWIHVDDMAEALMAAAKSGRAGDRFLFAGRSEMRNIDLVRALCAELERQRPSGEPGGYARLISFVNDRKGHDFRYALDDAKTRAALGWGPKREMQGGLADTVAWYLANESWWRPLAKRA